MGVGLGGKVDALRAALTLRSGSGLATSRSALLGMVFGLFDLDESGAIEASELMALGIKRKELGQKERVWTSERNASLMQSMDKSEDGLIQREEFVQYFLDVLGVESDASFMETMLAFMACVVAASGMHDMRDIDPGESAKMLVLVAFE